MIKIIDMIDMIDMIGKPSRTKITSRSSRSSRIHIHHPSSIFFDHQFHHDQLKNVEDEHYHHYVAISGS